MKKGGLDNWDCSRVAMCCAGVGHERASLHSLIGDIHGWRHLEFMVNS